VSAAERFGRAVASDRRDVICVAKELAGQAQDSNRSKPGGLAMQVFHDLTDEQALWLQRIYQSRENASLLDHLVVPNVVEDVLVHKGLVRRWRNGSVEITLGGIREVVRRPFVFDDAQVGEPA
jgi:hypothetical protein